MSEKMDAFDRMQQLGDDRGYAFSDLVSYCNRVIGFMNGMADDLQKIAPEASKNMRGFAEQLDVRRVNAIREHKK